MDEDVNRPAVAVNLQERVELLETRLNEIKKTVVKSHNVLCDRGLPEIANVLKTGVFDEFDDIVVELKDIKNQLNVLKEE